MRRQYVENILDEYKLNSGKGRTYIAEAVELYYPGCALKELYSEIAARHGTTVSAVARCVSLSAASAEAAETVTPKELIARVKERILFENNE